LYNAAAAAAAAAADDDDDDDLLGCYFDAPIAVARAQ